ncbi:Uma2 family endonuclease [Oscillatoria sp. FACHB-1406]|uniref:Uma2 family endonuclease n=1 Tax=Oscillatoria sp. FACHB-1406 TaxID=2692846 RepID=UPI001684DF65|nr:Uma2 family endonuclease [Oscillatoria sp. FACHB-1406]MBD2577187.1 Uma2 family endonuclease [Oscillatoria sp. FACHB-1406]
MVSFAQRIPPLENGDRLNRYEFERRYNAMPHLKKAELIEGVVYLTASVRFKSHAEPHAHLISWFGIYQTFTPGVLLGNNPTVRLDLDNAPQPDIALFLDKQRGGQARLSKDDYIEGAPEFIAEIAASGAAIDLGDKKRAYRRNQVQEYFVWQVFEQKLDWFVWQEGKYVSLPMDEAGIIRSQTFPGLWLATRELLAGNMQRVLSILNEGLASAEHQAFLRKLSES